MIQQTPEMKLGNTSVIEGIASRPDMEAITAIGGVSKIYRLNVGGEVYRDNISRLALIELHRGIGDEVTELYGLSDVTPLVHPSVSEYGQGFVPVTSDHIAGEYTKLLGRTIECRGANKAPLFSRIVHGGSIRGGVNHKPVIDQTRPGELVIGAKVIVDGTGMIATAEAVPGPGVGSMRSGEYRAPRYPQKYSYMKVRPGDVLTYVAQGGAADRRQEAGAGPLPPTAIDSKVPNDFETLDLYYGPISLHSDADTWYERNLVGDCLAPEPEVFDIGDGQAELFSSAPAA